MNALEPLPCPICGESDGAVHCFNAGGEYEAYYVCIGCDEDTETEGPTVTAIAEDDAERVAIRAWNKWVIEHPERQKQA